ncbi:MAG: hypothetical protein HON55_00100 [Legionellales bacterium]|nr:hypothetical protein [Legionellales bacterium]
MPFFNNSNVSGYIHGEDSAIFLTDTKKISSKITLNSYINTTNASLCLDFVHTGFNSYIFKVDNFDVLEGYDMLIEALHKDPDFYFIKKIKIYSGEFSLFRYLVIEKKELKLSFNNLHAIGFCLHSCQDVWSMFTATVVRHLPKNNCGWYFFECESKIYQFALYKGQLVSHATHDASDKANPATIIAEVNDFALKIKHWWLIVTKKHYKNLVALGENNGFLVASLPNLFGLDEGENIHDLGVDRFIGYIGASRASLFSKQNLIPVNYWSKYCVFLCFLCVVLLSLAVFGVGYFSSGLVGKQYHDVFNYNEASKPFRKKEKFNNLISFLQRSPYLLPANTVLSDVVYRSGKLTIHGGFKSLAAFVKLKKKLGQGWRVSKSGQGNFTAKLDDLNVLFY